MHSYFFTTSTNGDKLLHINHCEHPDVTKIIIHEKKKNLILRMGLKQSECKLYEKDITRR